MNQINQMNPYSTMGMYGGYQTQYQQQYQPRQRLLKCYPVTSIVLIGLIGSCGSDTEEPATDEPTKATQQELTQPETEPTEADVPQEYKNALGAADTYANQMHMSKEGIRDQLTSEYGNQFPEEAADYAVENVKTDWNQNALETAKVYYHDMAMSKAEIQDQLQSEYGDKFTAEQAQYAVDHLDD